MSRQILLVPTQEITLPNFQNETSRWVQCCVQKQGPLRGVLIWTPSFLGTKGAFTLGSKSTKEIPKSSNLIAQKHNYGHKEFALGSEAKETPKLSNLIG